MVAGASGGAEEQNLEELQPEISKSVESALPTPEKAELTL